MIQLTNHMRLLVATTPLDMRKGIDGIAALCRSVYMENPMSGAVFLFRSRAGKHLRILMYDGQGYWICTKRLSVGKFPVWQARDHNALLSEIQACEAQVWLSAGDPRFTRPRSPWKRIEPRQFCVNC